MLLCRRGSPAEIADRTTLGMVPAEAAIDRLAEEPRSCSPTPTAWSIVPDPRRRDPLRDPAQGEEHVREHVSMEQVA